MRPDVPIFRDFNLVIEPGKSTALVGPSGETECKPKAVVVLVAWTTSLIDFTT